jgi:hypothetical protein
MSDHLPPLPWTFGTSSDDFRSYVFDASGAPVAMLFGSLDEMQATAELICDAADHRYAELMAAVEGR